DYDSFGDACDQCPDDYFNSCPVEDVIEDQDNDGIEDGNDNCILVANSNQLDSDGDLVGDACDVCPNDATDSCNEDKDADNDGIEDDLDNCPAVKNADQLDSDGDSVGDACDKCPNDAIDSCVTGPKLIQASLLNVESGCVTYIGDHPSEPGQGFEQKLEFCADGTVTKWWNPDPVNSPSQPGDLVQEGTWSYDGNVLVIETVSSVMGMDMNYTDKYGVAYTYDNGAKLDIYNASKVTPAGSGTLAGDYELVSETIITMGSYMDLYAVSTTITEVADNGSEFLWSSTKTVESTCDGFACNDASNGTTVTETSRALDAPGTLYDLEGTYIFQTSDVLVLERK
ncbi:MAG: hypothetical protein D6B28_09695, partial [Gammaproteobacteria bacterium]